MMKSNIFKQLIVCICMTVLFILIMAGYRLAVVQTVMVPSPGTPLAISEPTPTLSEPVPVELQIGDTISDDNWSLEIRDVRLTDNLIPSKPHADLIYGIQPNDKYTLLCMYASLTSNTVNPADIANQLEILYVDQNGRKWEVEMLLDYENASSLVPASENNMEWDTKQNIVFFAPLEIAALNDTQIDTMDLQINLNKTEYKVDLTSLTDAPVESFKPAYETSVDDIGSITLIYANYTNVLLATKYDTLEEGITHAYYPSTEDNVFLDVCVSVQNLQARDIFSNEMTTVSLVDPLETESSMLRLYETEQSTTLTEDPQILFFSDSAIIHFFLELNKSDMNDEITLRFRLDNQRFDFIASPAFKEQQIDENE